MIDLTLTRRIKTRIPSRVFFTRVCAAAESELRIPKSHHAEVGITVVGPRAMRTLNRKRRGIDKPTDVLSFPLHMKPITGYTKVILGDVFICPGIIEARAQESGVPSTLQLSWAVVHGLLHLAGYDHEKSKSAAARMSRTERRILSRLNR